MESNQISANVLQRPEWEKYPKERKAASRGKTRRSHVQQTVLRNLQNASANPKFNEISVATGFVEFVCCIMKHLAPSLVGVWFVELGWLFQLLAQSKTLRRRYAASWIIVALILLNSIIKLLRKSTRSLTVLIFEPRS